MPHTQLSPRSVRYAWRAEPAPWRERATPALGGPAFFLGESSPSITRGSALGTPWAARREDPRPELPARLVAGPAAKDLQARAGLDGRGAREPQRGGEGVARASHGPPTRQQGEGLPRGRRQEALK